MDKALMRNFEEVKPGLKRAEALEESARCLYCFDAPCIKACPTGINIPSFIKKITSGNLKGAAKAIMTANPVGASCSRVCPTEELCEGACVLNHSTKPIMIGDLQRFATDWAIKNDQVLFKKGQPNNKKIAIVGSGPAGLSAARELALLGYKVTIFEAKEEAGGLDTYGIVSFRLPQRISKWEVKQVESLDVEIRTQTRVGTDISPDELINCHDAVLLAAGMSTVPQLGIQGEELNGVYDAITFIEATKTTSANKDFTGKKVVVIGAGNTAIDAATCSVRLGAENVKILYRRTRKEMTAYDFEYEFAKQDGVEFRFLTAPVKIIGDTKGQVKQLECIRMEPGERDRDGRRRSAPVKASEFTLEADAVIIAIGQTRHLELIEAFDLENSEGVVKIDTSTYQTSNPKVFAAGDITFGNGQGEAMVVSAAEQGKKTAYAIHKQLNHTMVVEREED